MDQPEQKLVARYIMKRSEDIAVKQAAAAAIDRLCAGSYHQLCTTL